jgi:hypothetical protein
MWLLLVFAFGFTLLAPALFASPLPCVVDSFADYQVQGQCMLGNYTLNGFTFDSSATGGANLLGASQITVDPTGSTPTGLSLRFSTPGGFQVAQSQTAEYIFRFTLDPILPDIGGPVIDLPPDDPVTLTGEFCGDGTLYSGPKVQPVVCIGSASSGIFPARLQIAGSSIGASQSYDFPQLVTMVDNRLILDLTGPAHVDYFDWRANVTGGGPSSVPEPSTALLLMPALLALPWLRKRRLANGR